MFLRTGIGQAVAEVQLRGMASPLAEAPEGLDSEFACRVGDGDNACRGGVEKFVEEPINLLRG